ncbi:hypothetical protein SAMN02799631_04330 [Methylobacterium sp. 174MFSha1.1]|uniref:hypothetical protein n=1 Tax=Methylobacterium sp. 174MFSha1.1 TaxID=1502749 RepID=UPI0008DFDB8F|nr:hypothetical protein [Methylobacterium sp. 174MFSha1.1]SFV05976.1 hypothetical protein SAMN02799631_04330 [Methylobacterium sp. 174MFSha1.1]
MTHWSASYVGLSAEEIGTSDDRVCWDLARLVYRTVLGVTLPAYAHLRACPDERAQVAAAIAGETTDWPWSAVDPAAARDFDVVVFRIGSLDAHMGLICAPGLMLHVEAGQDSTVVPIRRSRWASRLSGLYRHAEMMDRTGG